MQYYIFSAGTAAAQFTPSNVNVSAESLDGPTPAARVTWSTTIPPECVTSVTVEFRTQSPGPVVATYTTNDTSGTAVVQTGLQCGTNYYITVSITGKLNSDSINPSAHKTVRQVLIGGTIKH